mmetsp:Transcript_9938/g.16708  ORF Transcript_9938/g.16708 Transcript_9938/m.16708 type:complete len:261 (+) Transcript_9938:225-1007(+)
MVVARSDGRIEIYQYLYESPFPTLCFETKVKSTITSIDAGHITMTSSKDILLSCYDGKILAIIDSKKFKEQGMMANENLEKGENRIADTVELKYLEYEKKQRTDEMKEEVEELEKQLLQMEQENNKLELAQRKSKQENGAGDKAPTSSVIAIDQFKVSYNLNLLPEEGAYIMTIDSQLPISQLIMQSKQNLDILEVKNNTARIQRCGEIQDPNISSLTYLVIEGEGAESHINRIEVKIRTSEGQQGNIQLIVLPKNSQAC